MTPPSRPTNALYDSRRSAQARGIGFPSCNTELARIPPNRRDPHGYYAAVGVDPSATDAQIRAALRRRLARLHPDTGSGDVEQFQYVKLIGEVLLDPVAREAYNRTPPGQRLLDAVYAAELTRLDELSTLDPEEVEYILKPSKANPYRGRVARFDYLAVNHNPFMDGLKAQMWYHFLIAVAPIVRYRSVIKVLMTDGSAAFDPVAKVMSIPRGWEPSSQNAFALFTHVAGMRPGITSPGVSGSHLSA